MNILSTTEALQLLNQRLQCPITRQLFWQSIVPALLASGYARKLDRDIAIDGEAWCGWWVGYIALREQRIAAGEWTKSRAYSADEAEMYRDGIYDDDTRRP